MFSKYKNKLSYHYPTIAICMLFFFSFLYRFRIADFNKILTIYPDELIYTGIAHSLADGFGFTLHHMTYSFQNCLYSFVLLPAYLFDNVTTRVEVIAAINCILMSSAVFPTYLIAKEISSDKKIWILSSTLVITIPDLTMSVTFMSENLFYPLMIWCIYFMLKSMIHIGSVKWIVLSAIFANLCYFTKAIALYLVLTYVAFLFTYYFYNLIKDQHIPSNSIAYLKQLCIYILSFIIPYIAVKKFVFSSIAGSYSGAVSNSTSSLTNISALLKLFTENFIYSNLAMLFIPLLIFLLFRKTMSKNSAILFYMSAIALCGALAVITIMISIYDSTDLFRLHMRYYSALFIPFVVIFLDEIKNHKAFENTSKILNSIYGIAIFLFVLIGFKVIGSIQYGCTADQAMLRYYNTLPTVLGAMNISVNIETVYKLLFILLFVLIMSIIIIFKGKSIYPITAIIIAINIYNNSFLIQTYNKEYTSEYNWEKYYDIEKINKWIDTLPTNDVVLVITDTYGDANSRMLDVYLNGNAYFTTVDFLLNNQSDNNIFNITPLSIPATMAYNNYEIDHVDYIIDATNTYDFSDVTKKDEITSSQLFVYKNNDTSNICYEIPAQQ